MFQPKEIAEYYDATQVHYEQWWGLESNHALHYGIWDGRTKNFDDALANTNRVLMEMARIKDDERILDAGCGVGGAAVFLCENKQVKVTGITLSKKQLASAETLVTKKGLDKRIDFYLRDYCNTGFPDGSFDVVWGCESICHTPTPQRFFEEAYRLLKPGGRLVMIDFFASQTAQDDPNQWMKKWGDSWAVSQFHTSDFFCEGLMHCGFQKIETHDYTTAIEKSALRMYRTSLLGSVPSELYKLFHPNVSKFAKNHYRCGYYQYKALKEGLWNYKAISAQKPVD